MSSFASAIPLVRADETTRVLYLRRVATISLLGLVVAAITGFVSAGAIAMVPALQGRGASLLLIFGAYGIAHYGVRPLVFSENAAARWAGFFGAAIFEGIAMGYLLLAAIVISLDATGSALLLIGQALGLTATAGLGITAYLWSQPRELSMVKAGLSAVFLPMLILMGVSIVFPIGGIAGIGISALFVVVSAAGLLYQMNQVLHQLRTDMHVEGAYLVTMGVLVLFWNVLSLLMRLQDRR
jgi:FtsH-binding integral membrane protein